MALCLLSSGQSTKAHLDRSQWVSLRKKSHGDYPGQNTRYQYADPLCNTQSFYQEKFEGSLLQSRFNQRTNSRSLL